MLPVHLVLYILCIAGQIACIAHTCSASIATSNRCSPQYASMTQLTAFQDTYSKSFLIVFTPQFLDHLLLFQLQVCVKVLDFRCNMTCKCDWHFVPSSPGILLYLDKSCDRCDYRINIDSRHYAGNLIEYNPFSCLKQLGEN